ncbi:serine/threonine-protein kinase [Actinomadura scrupuli]|uniref:serine/threonine-protein kinase n=1 Tax=Actinomadura scrupuli TaxID=559629 RepID=UPI003D96C8B6
MTMHSRPGAESLRPGDPRELGPYRVIGRLGRGGMGTVYLAETASGAPAAVKVINADLADDPSFRDRFRREVDAARRVRRFCTAPVVDANLDDDPLYVVTEYVEGLNLDERISTSGPMQGSSLEHLAVGVATALTAIHGAGIVHRDLKPANVLLSPIGPRVIDFGIARALDTVTQATRTGQFIGTPAYMAPEVIAGQTATPAADVFAWGAVVAYAGTGRAPFQAATVPAILYQVTQGQPVLDGLDRTVRAMVERALAKDPRQRPTAQQLLDGLVGQEHADTEAVTASLRSDWRGVTRADGPPQPPTRVAPRRVPSPRTRWILTGVAAVAGAALLATVLALALGGDDGPPTSATPVFSDDFAGSGSGWEGGAYTEYPFSTSGYRYGAYAVKVGGSDTLRLARAPYKGVMPQRALISADIMVRSGPDYGQVGLFCRDSKDDRESGGYLFLVRVDGKGVLIRKVYGVTTAQQLLAGTTAPGFRPGKQNRLQIACEQQGKKVRLRLWINERLAADHVDGTAALSADGLAGTLVAQQNGGGNGVTADFDNFEIAQING